MARKPNRKSKLPFDPSEPAMPVGFGPAEDDAIDRAARPGVLVNERAAAPPSLSDLQVPIPQPPRQADDEVLFDEDVEDPPTSEADRAALAKKLAQEALARARSEEAAVNLDDDDAVDLDDDAVDLEEEDDAVDLDDDDDDPVVEAPVPAPKKKLSLADRARRPKSAAEVIQEAKSSKGTAKPAPKKKASAKKTTKAKATSSKTASKTTSKTTSKTASKTTSKTASKTTSKKKKKKAPTKKAPSRRAPPPVEFESTSELMAQADQEAAVVLRAPIELDETIETPAQPPQPSPETTAELEPTAQMKPPEPPPAPAQAPRAALAVLGSVKVTKTWSVDQRPIFAAMWTAHRAHAQASGDLPMAAMASVLLDAADRVPPGKLIALEANINGDDYAVWVDADRGVVLGVASPPAVWLVGL